MSTMNEKTLSELLANNNKLSSLLRTRFELEKMDYEEDYDDEEDEDDYEDDYEDDEDEDYDDEEEYEEDYGEY